MWILTPEGFFSTTQSGIDPNKIQVRARKEKHLLLLLERVGEKKKDNPILVTKNRDYQYRIILDRHVFNEWMSKVIDTLDYSNFKSKAQEVSGYDEYVHLLHDIWGMGFEALGENWSEYINS